MAHQVHLRMEASAGRRWALARSLHAAPEAVAYAWVGCGITWLLGLLPAPPWHEIALGAVASGIICGAARSRAAAREADELRRFAEAARRGAESDWKALGRAMAHPELRRAAAAVEELVRAEEAERGELSGKAVGLESDLRRLTEEAARHMADMEREAAQAALSVRESALVVHATANLLARDSAGRLDATGRERLEQLRLHAEAVDQRLRDWIDGGGGDGSLWKSDSPATGVAAGGDNGGGVGRA